MDGIKNSNAEALGKKAWEIMRGIGYGERIIKIEYDGDKSIKKMSSLKAAEKNKKAN